MSFYIVYKRGPKEDFEAASWPSHISQNPNKLSEIIEMTYGKKFDWYGLHTHSPDDALKQAEKAGFTPKRFAPKAK